MPRDSYTSLIAHARRATLLDATLRLLSWDQETVMPVGGEAVGYRGRQSAQVAGMVHAMRTDPRVGEWLSACESDAGLMGDLDSGEAVNVRDLRRDYDRATKLPASLVEELSHTGAMSKHAWSQAKKANDFSIFKPHLETMVRLCRAKAECWGFPAGGEPWDALAEDHEEGMTARQVESLFTPLRGQLVALLEELLGSGQPPVDKLKGVRVPLDRQRALSRAVVERLGFDFSRGRVDDSQHPFCLPLHRDDVRMTSRYREDLPLDGLGSAMHESGHGIYNQNLPGGEWLDTPMGSPLRYAIHESQARLIENQVGRSLAFWRWCGPVMRAGFSPALDHASDDALFAASNTVRRSLIRTESDELTYNLHILVRFELERAMIRGDLSVADLPGAWAEKYRECLGVDVDDDARGCMQDIHWAQGAIGYFPTYTLGNLYAAQLYEAAEGQVGDLEGSIARGDFKPLVGWLTENVHQHGRRYTPARLCERVTGRPLESGPLLRYLRKKLSGVYGLR